MDRCELMERMEQLYFRTSSEFRAWLVKHHATATELGVVLHRKTTGERSMTWSEAVDQALCFGWIDSVARRLDDTRRVQRFTPRKPKSNWSAVNIKKVAELIAQGLMTPAGLGPLARREGGPRPADSYSNPRPPAPDPDGQARVRASRDGRESFTPQPPSHQ